MSTEILGYIGQTAQKSTEMPTVTRKAKPIHITNAIKSKLLGTLLIVGICCIAEEISDSYNAYKYHKKGGFYAENPCFKPQQKNYPYVDKFCKEFDEWYEEYNKNN